jgi:DNA invertase Pin-like site-specific DNA recombinase
MTIRLDGAVIYARKSTEQHADPESKSVALQLAAARAFAAQKGWRVSGEYVDDAVSGAETQRLVNRQRLINSEQPRRIITRDSSRFSRSDGAQAFGELVQLAERGFEIWFYQSDTQFKHGTFADNIVGFIDAEKNAEYRRQISRWVTDAMRKKAEAGFLTTKPCFGYDSVVVGNHHERRINAEHAAVIVKIFQLRAKGFGVARIARLLNQEEGTPSPRPWRPGAVKGWTGVTVHAALHRDLYRGVIVWNRMRSLIDNGRRVQVVRPRDEWTRVPAEHLRIVSEKQWKAAHQSMAVARDTYTLRAPGGIRGPRRDMPSKYLLVGFAKCGLCGGGIHVRVRQKAPNGKLSWLPTATPYYACTTHYQTGRRWREAQALTARDGGPVNRKALCPHVELWAMDTVNQAVLEKVLTEAMSPTMTNRVLAKVRQAHQHRTSVSVVKPLRRELTDLDQERKRLVDAIARTAAKLEILVERLKQVEARRQEILEALGEADAAKSGPSWNEIETQIRERLADYRAILAGTQSERARTLFSELLSTPITFTPFTDARGYRAMRFEFKLGMQAIFGEVINGPSPSQASIHYLSLTGVVRSNRRAA